MPDSGAHSAAPPAPTYAPPPTVLRGTSAKWCPHRFISYVTDRNSLKELQARRNTLLVVTVQISSCPYSPLPAQLQTRPSLSPRISRTPLASRARLAPSYYLVPRPTHILPPSYRVLLHFAHARRDHPALRSPHSARLPARGAKDSHSTSAASTSFLTSLVCCRSSRLPSSASR